MSNCNSALFHGCGCAEEVLISTCPFGDRDITSAFCIADGDVLRNAFVPASPAWWVVGLGDVVYISARALYCDLLP